MENVLRLFAKRVDEFSGQSHRSYQKAFSSFLVFSVGNYNNSDPFNIHVVFNWIVEIVSRGLTPNTVTFYLEKVASIYSRVAFQLEGGKTDIFKEVKKCLKQQSSQTFYAAVIKKCIESLDDSEKKTLIKKLNSNDFSQTVKTDEDLKFKWTCLALKAGVRADVIISFTGTPPLNLPYLNLISHNALPDKMRATAQKAVIDYIHGEPLQWFAMRMRPNVKYEQLLRRFSLLGDLVKMPEMFYPCEEVARIVGRKVVWKNKPLIPDIIFFRKRRSEIYYLFSYIYDLAWCYRWPGTGATSYAAIPDKAIEDFKRSIGFLSPDFDFAPAGEMDLKPGDEVVIVDGKHIDEHGRVIKKPTYDEDGNKIYRISLMHGHGHWDIGIDARLLKKA